jgi:hypothetical protein
MILRMPRRNLRIFAVMRKNEAPSARPVVSFSADRERCLRANFRQMCRRVDIAALPSCLKQFMSELTAQVAGAIVCKIWLCRSHSASITVLPDEGDLHGF